MKFTKPQQLFIDALKSGQYEQCKGQLANEHGAFCALGVACDLAVKHGVIAQFDGRHENLTKYPAVQEWLDMVTSDGFCNYNDYGQCTALDSLNDSGVTLPTIGKMIESGTLIGLFVGQIWPKEEAA